MAAPSVPSTGFRSLTTRLIVWVLAACGGVFFAVVATSNATSRQTAIAGARQVAEAHAQLTIARVERVLEGLESSTRLLAAAAAAVGPEPVSLDRLLRDFVTSHPRVFGTAAAFEANGLPPGLTHFAPYRFRDPAGTEALLEKDLASDDYRYWEREWYTSARDSGRAVWSEPYREEGRAGPRMVTFSAPFRHSAGGVVAGVVMADLRLSWLNDTAQEIGAGSTPPAAVAIVSRSGTVLAARQLRVGEALEGQLPESIRDRLEVVRRSDKGFLRLEPRDRDPLLMAWAHLDPQKTGWLVAVIVPEASVLGEVEGLRRRQAALAIGGLLLLGGVVVLLSRRLTRPIADLDGSARRLATGDLDARLPEVLSRDEVGRLTQAFHEMRVSLKTYIRDLAETTKAKERLEGELRVARRIQMAMLPGRSAGGPSAGWELAATLEPARQVGGDLYDHFEQDGRVFFLVGDVSGKGVPAALFMARAKTLFQVVAARETDPGEILRRVNLGLVAENDAGMFVTVACGSWDGRSGDLLYSCGGHEPAIRVGSDGKAAAIDAEGGPLLGLLDAASFPVHRVRLEPGEAIVLYTDGVSEANDPEGALFGAERLVAALSGRGGSSAADLTEALLAATREHAAGAPQSDDITILVLRCLPPG